MNQGDQSDKPMRLIIGNKNYSSWSLRAWLLLSAFEVPFREIRVPLFEHDTADNLRRYTRIGRVPVLHDADLVIWDSLAICEYVSEHYLAGKGWPADAGDRADGDFSIVDCFFAPVAVRFATYGISVSAQSLEYMQQLLSHPRMLARMAQASAESEVIERFEVGLHQAGMAIGIPEK